MAEENKFLHTLSKGLRWHHQTPPLNNNKQLKPTNSKTILVHDTSKDIWDAMRRKYQGSTKVKRTHLQALKHEFKVLTTKESESFDQYFAITLAIANRMSAQGERLQEVAIMVCLIIGFKGEDCSILYKPSPDS
ncbi:retrovirus-related Pol polyprotein from transposon TNT 1-94 [Trifolium pratense]|uniref:Retrovirus-related Pol polyprotein from transposon TNT 1-94 n=1 Tax=Trifolium pratense TaxID=57577 RepID=A0A2K3M2J6_TRIPR|nr:retrovirus-related Pol polyprotein from transposon TNT 1-94 [Trifolium pratense]